VATMSIGGSKNAGLLAARILSTSDPALADQLEDYRKGLEAHAANQDASLGE